MTVIVAMVQIETDDPRLDTLSLAAGIRTSAGTRALRQAVLDHLPKDVTRLIAVLPVEQARLLMMLHEAVGDDLGAPGCARPPRDYKPPRE